MSKLHFKGFENASSRQWKQQIQADLNGADYNETLIWHTPEGIDVKPFYHLDTMDTGTVSVPETKKGFKICQHFYVVDAQHTNKNIRRALEKGAESIWLSIPSKEVDGFKLLKNVPNQTNIYLDFQFLDVGTISQYAMENHHLNIDILGHLAKTGHWFHNQKEDHRILRSILQQTEKKASCISIDISLYQNAGANMVQQLAYALAHANEYLNCFNGQIKNIITFKVAVGGNYFFEIAKLRALRILWATLAEAYQIPTDCHLLCYPSKRNKTLYDYNVNLLRTTTEIMSAILGGADAVCNLPYDAIYHKTNEFSERIARNQLLVLRHESYFDQVKNPADGAYYIESITQQMAKKALDLFKEIESHGGYFKQLKDGTIQRKIKESAAMEQKKFDHHELVLLGTNKYPDPNDQMKDELELYPFVKTNSRKTIIEPIIEHRLSEYIEQNRLKQEAL